MSQQQDVIVVGSSTAAGIVVTELARAGLHVVVLEHREEAENKSIKEAAEETGNVALRCSVHMGLINRDMKGRVSGVSFFNEVGEAEDLEAEIVILGGNARENARLLLVSDINSSGQVGKASGPGHANTAGYGTHRMGWNRKESVVDAYGEVHECKGLYAIGEGQLADSPYGSVVNTIEALAHMTADRLLYRTSTDSSCL
ncbi:GMC oxidoreductase [Paenibacillus sp. sgz302251]|uniref:GMC oxidoreductase n=1 Tax=Paenibacillus sp. sgz302251 TaxID=3414493 RepID=UPI003C7CE261